MAIQNEIERYQHHRAAPYPDTPRYNLTSKGIQTWIQRRTLPERPLPRSLQQLPGYYPLYRAPLGSYLSPRTWHQYHKSYSRPIGGCLFEVLPKNIIDRICSFVPYEYLLLLRQTSHAMHTLVDPYQAPYHTMIACVLRAERDFAQHRAKAPYNLGCYTCFRVLPAGRFASNQPSQVIVVQDRGGRREAVVHLRRYCVDCGLRVGYHGPGDFIVRPTGQKSWICRCARVIHCDDASQCPVCKAICPFRSMAAARSNARRRYDQAANAQRSKLKIICSLSLQDITGHELV